MTGSYEVTSAELAAKPPEPPAFSPVVLGRALLRVVLKHWLLLTMLLVGAGAGAAVGCVLYVPLAWASKGVLTPERDTTDVKTLYETVKASDSLSALREEFKLPMDVDTIRKICDVELPPDTKKIEVSMPWGDSRLPGEVRTRLMQIYPQYRELNDLLPLLQSLHPILRETLPAELGLPPDYATIVMDYFPDELTNKEDREKQTLLESLLKKFQELNPRLPPMYQPIEEWDSPVLVAQSTGKEEPRDDDQIPGKTTTKPSAEQLRHQRDWERQQDLLTAYLRWFQPVLRKVSAALMDAPDAEGLAQALEESYKPDKIHPGLASAEMTNRLMELFNRELKRQQRTRLGSQIQDLQRQYETLLGRLKAAQKQQSDFCQQHGFTLIDGKALLLNAEVTALKAQLDAIEGNLSRKRVEKAAQESFFDNELKRLKNRVRLAPINTVEEQIVELERSVRQRKSELAGKESEHQKNERLFRQRFISAVDYKASRDNVQRLREDLAFDEQKMEKLKKAARAGDVIGDPDVEKVEADKRAKMQELQITITNQEKELASLKEKALSKQKEAFGLQALQPQLDEMAASIKRVAKEVEDTESTLLRAQTERDSSGLEFRVLEPAVPLDNPTPSARRKFFGIFAICGGGLAMLLVLGLEFFRAGGLFLGSDIAENLGLSILARLWLTREAVEAPTFRQVREAQLLRQFALRIRQSVTERGALVLCDSLQKNVPIMTLSAQLAGCFARRNERLVIVGAQGGDFVAQDPFAKLIDQQQLLGTPGKRKAGRGGALPGLADYLTNTNIKPADIVLPSMLEEVDCIVTGSVPLSPDALATYRMGELIKELKQCYTMILVIGPDVSRSVEIEILAAHAQGIFFCVTDDVGALPQTRPVIRKLKELNAPILGAAVLNVGPRSGFTAGIRVPGKAMWREPTTV